MMETAMKRPAQFLFAAFLVFSIAGSVPATAAEGLAVQQDLVNVKASRKVVSAVWKREADSYTLRVLLDRSVSAATAEEMRQQGIANVSEALALVPRVQELRPSPIPNWRGKDGVFNTDADRLARSSFFIGETIARLRSMDPSFGCNRSLTRDRRVEVWLLKADGTHVQPVSYGCEDAERALEGKSEISVSYGYSIADSAQAVAAAIKIDDDFYIDKLQPLIAAAPAQ
jgi:hypothetical protein